MTQFHVACRRRKTFCMTWLVRLAAGAFLFLLKKKPKQGKGEPDFPLCKPHWRLAALDTNIIFLRQQKNKSVLRADALKKCLRRIFIARALEREGRTTTPLPSSEEGNYAASRLTLFS